MKYMIKLINDEKLIITEKEWETWRHWKAGDMLIINSDNSNPLFIPKRNIVFGFILGEE